jgi:hypothetical protein
MTMSIEQVRTLRLSQPFRPFRIQLTGGTELVIEQPYYVAVATDLSEGIVSSMKIPRRFRANEVTSVQLIDSPPYRTGVA